MQCYKNKEDIIDMTYPLYLIMTSLTNNRLIVDCTTNNIKQFICDGLLTTLVILKI